MVYQDKKRSCAAPVWCGSSFVYDPPGPQLATDFGLSGSLFAKCKAILQVQRQSALRKENQL